MQPAASNQWKRKLALEQSMLREGAINTHQFQEFKEVGKNNGQLRIANATLGGTRKAAWAKRF